MDICKQLVNYIAFRCGTYNLIHRVRCFKMGVLFIFLTSGYLKSIHGFNLREVIQNILNFKLS